MTECVIFDLDGTLVDSQGVCVAILSEMLADRGSARTIHPALARPWLSIGGARMVAALLGDACGDPEAEIADFRRRYAERPTPAASLYLGVREGLRALATAGKRLAICSNKPQALVDKVLTDLHLAPLFEIVVGARPGYRAKPATDLLDLVLLSMRRAAAECTFVGDSHVDHAVATAAGVPFRFVSYGYAEPGWTADGLVSHDAFDDMVGAILTGAPVSNARRRSIGSANSASSPAQERSVSRAA